MEVLISVIICTHNPRYDYLTRVLNSLENQTLDKQLWELLLIDNASKSFIKNEYDLSWHPYSRHIHEKQLGLTFARVRGIEESKSEILVMVDDDNVLDPTYLESALKISHDYPMIGSWGGKITAEFESIPPEWTKPFQKNLAINNLDRDIWSNLIDYRVTTPCGAGMCLRREVAQKYIYLINSGPRRMNLGRNGNSLNSGEDTDLAITACDLGLGTGLFTCLKLTHLLPNSRLQENYLLRLEEGMSYSLTIFNYLRGFEQIQSKWRESIIYLVYLYLRYGLRRYRFYLAALSGRKRALETIENWKTSSLE
jgi:glycosyltransferase involved in cell wall biosynthesis